MNPSNFQKSDMGAQAAWKGFSSPMTLSSLALTKTSIGGERVFLSVIKERCS